MAAFVGRENVLALTIRIGMHVFVVACVLDKVGKSNQGSGKHKGTSRYFRKKTRFKL